jgi:transposase
MTTVASIDLNWNPLPPGMRDWMSRMSSAVRCRDRSGPQQAGRAKKALKEWLGWASRSRLRPFVRVARTIRKYRDGVLAYIDLRLTNGPVEGINNRLRTVAPSGGGREGTRPVKLPRPHEPHG